MRAKKREKEGAKDCRGSGKGCQRARREGARRSRIHPGSRQRQPRLFRLFSLSHQSVVPTSYSGHVRKCSTSRPVVADVVLDSRFDLSGVDDPRRAPERKEELLRRSSYHSQQDSSKQQQAHLSVLLNEARGGEGPDDDLESSPLCPSLTLTPSSAPPPRLG